MPLRTEEGKAIPNDLNYRTNVRFLQELGRAIPSQSRFWLCSQISQGLKLRQGRLAADIAMKVCFPGRVNRGRRAASLDGEVPGAPEHDGRANQPERDGQPAEGAGIEQRRIRQGDLVRHDSHLLTYYHIASYVIIFLHTHLFLEHL